MHKTSAWAKKHRSVKPYKKKSKFSPKRYLLGGLFFSLLLAAGYLFLFWPGWQVESIIVNLTDDNLVKPDQVQIVVKEVLDQKIWGWFGQSNVLLASAKIITGRLADQFPQIDNTEIEKHIKPKFSHNETGSSLEVTIKLRQAMAIWCPAELLMPVFASTTESVMPETGLATSTEKELLAGSDNEQLSAETIVTNCYYLDQNGIIYAPSPIFEGGLVLSIYDFSQLKVKLGQQILPDNLTAMIIKIKELVPEVMKKTPGARGLGINHLEIHALEEIDLITNEDWEIIFNPSSSAISQIAVLASTLQQEIKDNRQQLEYIDLRIENRAYYK